MKRKDHADGHTLRLLCLTNAARRSLAPADLKTEAIDWLRMPSQTNKIIQVQQFLELFAGDSCTVPELAFEPRLMIN
jgi:hypothetical protein